jgi:Holliday junction resolvase RusA-like endonuclease
MSLKFTIPLNPVTKKNSNVRTKQGGTIASKAYRQYEKDAVRLIPGHAKQRISEPVNVKAVYYTKIDYYAEHRKSKIDLQNLHNALADTLVAAGVVEDDNCRIIYSMDGSCVKHDKIHPRTEVEITRREL